MADLAFRLTRWSDRPPLDERAGRARLSAEGLAPYTWGNPPGDTYAPHAHGYDKVLICLSGSIVFDVGGESVELLPGDRLDLPADTIHAAVVGRTGVVCLEAHRTRAGR